MTNIELDGHACVVFGYFLLAAVPGLGSNVGIFDLREAQENLFGLLPITLGHANNVSEVFVEVDVGVSVRHVGELHAENSIAGVVAQVSIVAVAAAEEPAVVVLLEVVGVDNERLGLCHPETLIAQLHSGLLADGVEEWGEVPHPFIIHGRLEADSGAHFFMITHAEVEAGAELCHPVGLRHAVEALEDVQGLGEMQKVVLRELGGEDGEVGILILKPMSKAYKGYLKD